jgi:hypothetical protein
MRKDKKLLRTVVCKETVKETSLAPPVIHLIDAVCLSKTTGRARTISTF